LICEEKKKWMSCEFPSMICDSLLKTNIETTDLGFDASDYRSLMGVRIVQTDRIRKCMRRNVSPPTGAEALKG